jgi:hypothetical protein
MQKKNFEMKLFNNGRAFYVRLHIQNQNSSNKKHREDFYNYAMMTQI